MSSRKRKRSRVADDNDGVASDDGAAEEEEEALVKRLSQSQMFNASQSRSETQREAGIIEEVQVTNFMSHSKLSFQ